MDIEELKGYLEALERDPMTACIPVGELPEGVDIGMIAAEYQRRKQAEDERWLWPHGDGRG